MASTYKTFLSDDVASTRTLLHEAIPITGSIIYGTYGTLAANNETHVKKFGHGMFQSVYDYAYQSSSANHIFDLTHGHNTEYATQGVTSTQSDGANYDGNASLANITSHDYFSKRKNVYNQMAQILSGHKVDGSIRDFDRDGDLVGTAGNYNALIFMNFARLLGKDEIKKGSFSIELGATTTYDATHANMHADVLTITDAHATSDYKINSPAGEYGILKASSGGALHASANVNCGLIYYQAGIVALTPDVFMAYANGTYNEGKLDTGDAGISGNAEMTATQDILALINNNTNETMDEVSDALRQRIKNVSFSNTTELNSTIYFCRVGHNDFNYSTNPTYLEDSKIRVKNNSTDAPVSYITTVGMYSSDNELLAVAKLSEPLRKDPTNDITLRVRLDY